MKNLDAIITETVYLAAMEEYLRRDGTSRGSYLVLDAQGESPCAALGDSFRYRLGDDPHREQICETRLAPDGQVQFAWVDRRPIPDDEGWFENVWAAYREDGIIRE